MKVLVASQDPTELARIVDGLSLAFDLGLHVTDDPASVVALVIEATEPFDLVVVDGDLRPRGGYAAIYELRAAEQAATRVPVPAIVVGSRSQDTWLGQWSQANEVIHRPVDPFQLARVARRTARRLVRSS